MYPFSVRRVPTVGCVNQASPKAAFFTRKRLLMAAAAFGGLMAASEAGAADICNSYNIGGTLNGPNRPLFCTVTESVRVTELATYHWNNGRGAPPGTIRLRDNNGRIFGPFQATASSGQGGAPSVNWSARVDFILPPGAYHVIDSDNATWSWNGQSGGRGFAAIRGAAAYNPLPQGPGCGRLSGAVADTSPCRGAVRNQNIQITMRLKREIPARIDPVVTFYVPGRPSVAVVRSVVTSGSGTAINSNYTFNAGPAMCVNTGVTYAIRVTVGGASYGDVGGFTPDCR